jgi:hypothetical protein
MDNTNETDYNTTQFGRLSDIISDKLHNKYIGIEPMLLIAVIALLIIYYYVFSSLGNNEDGNASGFKVFIETLLWLLFIVLLLLNGMSYIFGIDTIKTIKEIFGFKTNTIADLNMNYKMNEIKPILKSQVFHLPERKYSYTDAQALCKAYDSRLANFDELNDAYNSGADWCNYGWSENQMALFPTQEEKWNKLQTLQGHEKDCGHPGINGGYIDNPDLKFGVNCFGNKPSITDEQAYNMRQKPIYNKNAKEIKFDSQVDYWRNNLSQIEIAPFNHNNWSML